MQDWEKAATKFLKNWSKRKDVIGALVCGSYALEQATTCSDIDLHIILSDSVTWRERGNKIVDGFLIEYFANPVKQMIHYFNEYHKSNRNNPMVHFLTGRILYDPVGRMKELKNVARQHFRRKFKIMDKNSVKLYKYLVWDNLDNLKDKYDQDSDDFNFVYFNCLNDIFEIYSKFLRLPLLNAVSIYPALTSNIARKKYLLNSFPDRFFAGKMIRAIKEKSPQNMFKYLEQLTLHIQKEMGGFKIDGFKTRTPLDIKEK